MKGTSIRRHCMSWVYAASHPSSYTLKPACWIRLQSDPGVEQHPAYISGNLPIPKFFDETPGPDAKVKTLDAISFLLSPNIVSESIKAQINLQTAPHGLMTQRSQDLQVEAKLPTTLTQWRAWIHGTAKCDDGCSLLHISNVECLCWRVILWPETASGLRKTPIAGFFKDKTQLCALENKGQILAFAPIKPARLRYPHYGAGKKGLPSRMGFSSRSTASS